MADPLPDSIRWIADRLVEVVRADGGPSMSYGHLIREVTNDTCRFPHFIYEERIQRALKEGERLGLLCVDRVSKARAST